MASAVISQNDENHNFHYMAKLPKNPNPNSKTKKNRNFKPVTQSHSDDAYSQNTNFSQSNQISKNPNLFNPGEYIFFSLSNLSKSELSSVKNRLKNELESVKKLNFLIESGKFVNKKRPNFESFESFENEPRKYKKLCQKVVPLIEIDALIKMCKTVLSKLMKHKLSWVFNKPVDVVNLGLHDYHQIITNPMDLGTVKSNLNKGFYLSPEDFARDVRLTFNNALLYNPKGDEVHNMADLLLKRFEELYSVVKEKYTIKTVEIDIDELQGSSWNGDKPKKAPKKPKNKPVSVPLPVEKSNFVGNVGFEPNYVENVEIERNFDENMGIGTNYGENIEMEVENSGKVDNFNRKVESFPKRSEKVENFSKKAESLAKTSEKVETSTKKAESLPPNIEAEQNLNQIPIKSSMRASEKLPKLPKPRAKDPNKRAMSMEEKHKLSVGLQNLPQEKMNQLVHIIKKRNAHMVQEGDEIELDIEAIDIETLWELDRFVTNWKKSVSKLKRQSLLLNNGSNSGFAGVETETPSGDDNVVSENFERNEVVKKANEVESGEDEVDVGDDVDIGDDVPMSSFPPVEIENDDGGGGIANENNINNNTNTTTNNNNGRAAASSSSSSSSSSGSDSSSSSDSDSGSSSGSDSDADDAQSKGLGGQDASKQRLGD